MQRRADAFVSWVRLNTVESVLALCVSAPLLIAAVRLVVDGWWPSGDDALISLRASDVWSTRPPLQGQRSTSFWTSPGAFVHHPGPLPFYVLGVFGAMTAMQPPGLVLGGLVVAIYAVIVAVLATSRVAGRWGAGGMAALLILLTVQWQASLLVRPYNLTATVLPMAGWLAACWAAMVGRQAFLVHVVLLGSYVAQSHLAALPLVVAGWVLVAAVQVWNARDALQHRLAEMRTSGRRRLRPQWQLRRLRRLRRPGVVASSLGLLILLWLPAVIEVVVYGRHSNVSQLLKYIESTSGGRQKGIRAGLDYTAEQMTSWQASPFYMGGADRVVPGYLIGGVLVLTIVLPPAAKTYVPQLARLRYGAVLALIGLLVESWSVGRLEEGRGLLYGAVFLPVAYFAELVAGLVLVGAVIAWASRTRRVRAAVPNVALVVAVIFLLVVGSGIRHATGDTNTGANASLNRFVDQVVRHVEARARTHQTVVIYSPGVQGSVLVAPTLAYRLERMGYGTRYQFYWNAQSEDNARSVNNAPPGSLRVFLHERDDGRWVTTPPPGGTDDNVLVRHHVRGGLGFPDADIRVYVY